jgi:hypothetical protein
MQFFRKLSVFSRWYSRCCRCSYHRCNDDNDHNDGCTDDNNDNDGCTDDNDGTHYQHYQETRSSGGGSCATHTR